MTGEQFFELLRAGDIVQVATVLGDQPEQGGFTPLQSAASQGNVAMVRALLEHGADRSLKADDGRTAIDLAGERAEVVAVPRA